MRFGLKHPQSVEKPFGVIAPPRDKKKKNMLLTFTAKVLSCNRTKDETRNTFNRFSQRRINTHFAFNKAELRGGEAIVSYAP